MSSTAVPRWPRLRGSTSTCNRPQAGDNNFGVKQRTMGGMTMKLYMHPVSTATRPVRLFIAENGIECDEEMVDILKGAHYQEPYASLNPNRMVPMLEDGDLRLTESSAILKYLADKIRAACLPQGPEAARQGQRDDGLAQYPVLSRLRLRTDLSADLPASQAAQR